MKEEKSIERPMAELLELAVELLSELLKRSDRHEDILKGLLKKAEDHEKLFELQTQWMAVTAR